MEFAVSEKSDSHNTPAQHPADNVAPSKTRNKHQKPWLIFLVFFAIVVAISLTRQRHSINWVEDYHVGIEQAKKQNKPVMMTIYKDRIGGRFTRPMFEETFENPEVIKFIHENFVPILVNAFKQPDIAKKFNFNYDPTHFVISPETETVLKTRQGHDPPHLFISELTKALQDINQQKNK